MIESKAIGQGICCDSCQEDLNVHGCWGCHKNFEDQDKIFCKHHSQSDCEHYHEDCRPSEKEEK